MTLQLERIVRAEGCKIYFFDDGAFYSQTHSVSTEQMTQEEFIATCKSWLYFQNMALDA
jgi:hypothetical protein